jgi:hypothetical protein
MSPQLAFVLNDAIALQTAKPPQTRQLHHLHDNMATAGLTYDYGEAIGVKPYHGPAFGQHIACLWREAKTMGDSIAEVVANAFVDQTGEPAWWRHR